MPARTRVPGEELAKHFRQGTPAKDYRDPIRGAEDILREMDDALVEHGDPMEGSGGRNFIEPQSVDAVRAAVMAQAMGLDSGVTDGYPDQVPSNGVGMGTAINLVEMSQDQPSQDNEPFGPEPKGGIFASETDGR